MGARDGHARGRVVDRSKGRSVRCMSTCHHVRAFVETRADAVRALISTTTRARDDDDDDVSEDDDGLEEGAWTHACATCARTCSTARERREHAHDVFYDRAREALTCARCASSTAAAAAAAFPLRDAVETSSRRARGLRGSVNMGNTCFMASVVQALAATTAVTEYFLRENHRDASCDAEHCLACAFDDYLEKAFREDEDGGGGGALVACDLLYTWWSNDRSFARQAQQDAHEFFLHFVSIAHANVTGARPTKRRNVCLATILSLEAPYESDDEDETTERERAAAETEASACECVFHRAFAGLLRSDVSCVSCGACSTRLEPTVGVSLDVRSSTSETTSLEACLEDFTATEVIQSHEGATRVCAECSVASTTYEKRMRFERAPRVLNVHLKRFEGDFESMRKNDAHVRFPLRLDLSPYVSDATPSSSLASNSSTPSERRRLERLSSYRLYAVVVHSGVLEGGHYVAYVKRRGRWFLCDDASVEPVSETRVLAAQAFMLFYESETSSGKE